MGQEYTCILDMCLLPKKGYSYIEAQSLYVWRLVIEIRTHDLLEEEV